MKRVIVRGFGYKIIHQADVPEAAIQGTSWLGAPFDGVETPVVALCGQEVRSVQAAIVVMPDETAVTCRHCVRAAARSVPTGQEASDGTAE